MGIIGSGSSGIVKRVLHKATRATYVLKIINFDVGNELLRKQITTELKTLYGAQHPHIVQYHQSYFANGAITILMEHMDGGSLYDLLLKVGGLWGKGGGAAAGRVAQQQQVHSPRSSSSSNKYTHSHAGAAPCMGPCMTCCSRWEGCGEGLRLCLVQICYKKVAMHVLRAAAGQAAHCCSTRCVANLLLVLPVGQAAAGAGHCRGGAPGAHGSVPPP
jgi:hypothetical protein